MQGAEKYMDCSQCPLGHEQRSAWNCGFLAESERTGVAPVPPDYPGDRPDVCPGMLVSMPQVIEAARAASWRKDGALSQFYDGRPLTEIAKYAIDILIGHQRQVENYNIRSQGAD